MLHILETVQLKIGSFEGQVHTEVHNIVLSINFVITLL